MLEARNLTVKLDTPAGWVVPVNGVSLHIASRGCRKEREWRAKRSLERRARGLETTGALPSRSHEQGFRNCVRRQPDGDIFPPVSAY